MVLNLRFIRLRLIMLWDVLVETKKRKQIFCLRFEANAIVKLDLEVC